MNKVYTTPDEFYSDEKNPHLAYKYQLGSNEWRQWTTYRDAHKDEIDETEKDRDPLAYDLREHAKKREKERGRRSARQLIYSALVAIQGILSGAIGAVELGDKHGSFLAFLESLGMWDLGLLLPISIGAYWLYRGEKEGWFVG